jgi:hypothetical protein
VCVLDKDIDERIVHRGAEMALERPLLLLCAGPVESLEMYVVGRVSLHVRQGRCEREGVRLGLAGEFLEGGEKMEERGRVLTEGFG